MFNYLLGREYRNISRNIKNINTNWTNCVQKKPDCELWRQLFYDNSSKNKITVKKS